MIVNIFREQTAAKIHNVLKRIAIPAIIYALMMNLILLAYVGITKIQ